MQMVRILRLQTHRNNQASKPDMMALPRNSETINFGAMPETIDALLQQRVVPYRHDRACAVTLFRRPLAEAPAQLPIYFCLYKIHMYQGNLHEAQAVAETGLREAACQAGWVADWQEWQPPSSMPDGAGRFALYTLKALALIHLRQNDHAQALQKLEALRHLDPGGMVGCPVVAALAEGTG